MSPVVDVPEDVPAAEPQEPPASEGVPGIPREHLIYLHGKAFVRYAGLLSMAHERGLVSLSAKFVSVTAELAIAEATAVFRDGRSFCEAGDASPNDVNPKVIKHFKRVSLTRAKARCLRDALNCDLVAVEELDHA